MLKIPHTYKKEANLLIKKILMVKKNKSEIANIFTNHEVESLMNYDTSTFLKGSGIEIFDLVSYIIEENDKKEIDDFFNNEGVSPQSIGSIFNLYDKESPVNEYRFSKFFRVLARSSYQFLKTFPSLRDKFSIIYADKPENLYKGCKSFAHFKLLKKTMAVEPTPECLIFTLQNLIEINKNNPFYLKEAIPYKKTAFKNDEIKTQQKENHSQIIQWAIDNILIFKNEKLNQSAVSILLNNSYSEKELINKGFPKISWEDDILVVDKQTKNNIKKIIHTNHFSNTVSHFNYKLLKSNYVLRECDWYLLPQLENVVYSATDAQKTKIQKIIKNSLFQIDNIIDNPIPEMIFQTPAILNKETDKITMADFDFNNIKTEIILKYLNIFQENGINIYDITEKNGIQQSVFINAFLSQKEMLSSYNKESLDFIDFFDNAPQDNKDIIIDFFEKKCNKMLEIASLKQTTFQYHLPFLTFISNLKEDITSNLVNNILDGFSKDNIKKRFLNNASDTSQAPNNLSIVQALERIEMHNNRFVSSEILNRTKDDEQNHQPSFKI